MLFNSLEFAIFLPVVFALYWVTPPRFRTSRNVILLLASYVFYGWWDWRFLSLILISSVVDYSVGMMMVRVATPVQRKFLLWASVLVNLGFLGIFKYYNFFIESFSQAFIFFGMPIDPSRLNIVLPVGISFYTFQTLSYTIDIYRGKMKPTHDPIGFFAFVAFFPQLVAGPIERASHLLPQFSTRKKFHYDQSVDGLRQILWGLFKKVVIADNCALVVNATFADPSAFSASTLALGAILFAFQIYGDFSGYSDIAIGTARLFGFDLKQNFAFPYFSRDIGEFWRRWHISLSSWFRDYLYIPLGGSRGSKLLSVRNTMIVFLVSGFWHGANWTFVIWGLLHGLFFLPLLLTNSNRRHLDPIEAVFPSIWTLAKIVWTFIIVDIAWVFFRAESVGAAIQYLGGLFSWSIFSMPEIFPFVLILQIGLMLIVEWLNRTRAHGLSFEQIGVPISFRWAVYLGLAMMVLFFGGSSETFIYFQF